MPDKKSKIQFIERKYIISISAIIFTIVLISLVLNWSSFQIGNNVTLIVEIGVGVVIAIVVYAVSRKSEIKVEEKVEGLFDIIKTQDDFRQNQIRSVKDILLTIFNKIDASVDYVLHIAESYNDDESSKKIFKSQIMSECNKIKSYAENKLDDPDIVSKEFFDLETIQKFKTLSFLCKKEPFTETNSEPDVDFCNKIKKMIQPWIEEFSKDLGKKVVWEEPKKPEEIKKEPTLITESVVPKSEPKTVPISVSADRTVYPLDSVIHVRANLPTLLDGETLLFEIFNVEQKLLLSKEIDPLTYDQYPELKEAGLYQVCFKMQGKDWKVGETYFVTASYGTSVAEDSFLIDQRMPVLQSDKSVYTMGSDMIITVIDPDADKDNQKVEYVGDRDDSKLVIESPYGKIDGYKLRETGDSTGIFQGIIGILGIRKNGSVIPQKFDGKVIDKIQGTGIENGFIGGKPGDELVAHYTNKSGTVHLTFYISNFGSTVELDQKIYKPNDKVYFTIIAPDLNLNSNKVDEIGLNPESLVEIRTSKGKLEQYKLVETQPDSGIFTGEIQLTTDKNESNSSSKNLGPKDGRLVCSEDDFIEVKFRFFDDEVTGCAMIKF